MSTGVSTISALTNRELLRFIRQPSRIVAAIGTPMIIWVVLAGGFAGSFAAGTSGGSYGAFLVPGMSAMTVVFASIFAAMSLIEDRNEGFLQTVLVSPAPSAAMVLGKALPASVLACAQGMLIVLASPLAGLSPGAMGLLMALGALMLMSLGVVGLGLGAAWRVNSTSGFHGVMNLVLMPMLLLSGAFFPIDTAAGPMRTIMRINPLSWPVGCVRSALDGASAPAWMWVARVIRA